MSDNSFQKLLDAANELLASRYRDGEVDAYAMSKFASVVKEVTPATHETADHIGHRLIIEKVDIFLPRCGCLDCDVWLDPVRLKSKGV